MATATLHPESAQATRAPHARPFLTNYTFADATRDMQRADEKFWAAHTAWRAAEDACERDPRCGDDPEWQAMCDTATDLRDAMFGCGVFSASALLAKLTAINEGPAMNVVSMDLANGSGTIFDVVLWDCERVANRELQPQGSDPIVT